MKFSVKSDKGKVRELNEDSFLIMSDNQGLPDFFMVADGMGGHNAGEVASRAAVDYAMDFILQFKEEINTTQNIEKVLREIVYKTNEKVFALANSNEENHGMGTTLIISMALEDKAYFAHVGDSRAYLVSEDKIKKITIDHSLVEELIKLGELTEEEAANHPKKNIITKALGCTESIEPDIYEINLQKNDIIILCSDGLSNLVDEKRMLEIVLNSKDTSEMCDKLVDLALIKGGEDNITVVVAKND